MRTSLLVLLCLFLYGCDRPQRDWTTKRMDLTQTGLKDCVLHEINTGARTIYVVRCPRSDVSTTYHQGKTTVSNTVTEQ